MKLPPNELNIPNNVANSLGNANSNQATQIFYIKETTHHHT